MTQQSKNAPSASPHYRAYLVRFWRDDAQETWRASAQSVQSGELSRFATLHELFAFLEIDMPTPQTRLTEGCGCDVAT